MTRMVRTKFTVKIELEWDVQRDANPSDIQGAIGVALADRTGSGYGRPLRGEGFTGVIIGSTTNKKGGGLDLLNTLKES